ncbi:MAG TPA: hypothetical protein VFX50_03465 [Gemmatimonadales bacterium]|nr:hypothetical protein [Gemmatimonadales bacterium]
MTRLFASALAAALVLAVPASGHAQLGKLVNKGKKAVTGEATGAAAAQVPPRQVDALPANLTAADLDKAIAGFKAELAAAPGAKSEADRRNKQLEQEQKAYEKAVADYEKKDKAYQACREKIDNDPALKAREAESAAKGEQMQQKADAMIDEKELEEMAKKLEPALRRMQAGTATEADKKAIADFQAKMAQINGLNAEMMAQHAQEQKHQEGVAERYKACGPEPERPRSPPSTGHSPESVMLESGGKAAAMSEDAYRLLREYAIMSTSMRVTPKGRTQEQADAINAKLDELQAITQQMRSAGIPT